MLAATRNTKRFLEITQLVLAFIGTCTVVDTTLLSSPHRPGFAASVPLRAAAGDQRFRDLARTDRKRREAEQQTSRRAAAREAAVVQRSSAS